MKYTKTKAAVLAAVLTAARVMDVAKSERADGTNVQQYGTVAEKTNNT